MAKLALQEGDHVSLKSVRLPKGEYAQLQPQSASWIDIPMATREAMYAHRRLRLPYLPSPLPPTPFDPSPSLVA
jgi:hypothetical protein